IAGAEELEDTRLALAAQWDLSFDGALAGTLDVQRLSGDIMVPAEPPFPLGLQALELSVAANPVAPGSSQLVATLDVDTADMGQISATASTRLHATPAGGLFLE